MAGYDLLMEKLDQARIDGDEAWVLVGTYRDLPQAHIAAGTLEARGLTPKLADEYTVGADWLLSIAIGGVRLGVPASQEDEARELLARESFDAATTPDLPEELRPETDREEEEAEERYFDQRKGSKRFRAWSSSVFIDPILLVIVSLGWAWDKIAAALGRSRREAI